MGKNAVYKYDKGQCLVREVTCNTDILPKRSQLNELAVYISQHEPDQYHPYNLKILANTFRVLWGRLTDYQRLRHVEKSLLVIQYLLDQDIVSDAFTAYCRDRKRDIAKLKSYHYKIDGTDIGQNVRQRASSIYETLWNDEKKNSKYLGVVVEKKPFKKPRDTKKKRKKRTKSASLLRFNSVSHSVNSIESESESEEDNDGGSNDIFDIFGELPVVEQSEENEGEVDGENDSFLESKTSTLSLMQLAGIDVVHSDSEQ